MTDDVTKSVKNDKQTLSLIKKLCEGLALELIAARKEQDVAKKQISLMNDMIRKANFADFWETFVIYADMKAIMYFWPDPADEKVYLKSKELHEKVEKKAAGDSSEMAAKNANVLLGNGNTTDFMNSHRNLTVHADGTVDNNSKIRIMTKDGPTAFALGISKKDQKVRYVEQERFSKELLNVVIQSGRADVLAYFVKQCGGMTEAFRAEMIKQWISANAQLIYDRYMLDRKIASLEDKKKKADDKFELQEIREQIFELESKKLITKEAVSNEMAAYILHGTEPLSLLKWASELSPIKDKYDPPTSVGDIMLLASSMKQGNVDGMAEALGSEKRLREEECAPLKKIYFTAILSQIAYAFKTENPNVAKWTQWRKDKLNNWKGGVPDPLVPMAVSQGEWNCWHWERGIALPGKPGFTSQDTVGTFRWTPGTPYPELPELIAGEKEGTWKWESGASWTAGTPHPRIKGLIADTEVNTWKLTPGYKKDQTGKVIWQIGMMHPSQKGMIASEESGVWEIAPGYQKGTDGVCVWTPGLPDIKTGGRFSAVKEGSWKLFDGFQYDKSGKVTWTPGTKHNTLPNIVAGKERFQWVPADGYKWAHPEDENDMSVIKMTGDKK